MTSTIKMKIDLNIQEVKSDDVLASIFKISDKSKNSDHARIAKDILILAAKRGEQGLWATDWKNYIKNNNIKEHTYFQIIKRLKNAGLLRKSRKKYYVIRHFNNHLMKMATAMNLFYMDIGVVDVNQT